MPFPENKKHVSFSEIKIWKECPHRHRLMYIDGHKIYEPNPYADFGTALHDTIEHFLKTKELDLTKSESMIRAAWEKNGFDTEEYLLTQKDNKWYKHKPVDHWVEMGSTILNDFSAFMDETFPEWEYVHAELPLLEEIEGTNMNFKGFVDAVIKTPKNKKKGTWIYHVIDWKTTGKAGWGGYRLPGGGWYNKRKDFNYLMQVGLYKKFVSQKLNIPLKDIRTGFVFLKRDQKAGKTLELLKVSCGPKFIEKADKVVTSMLSSVERGFYPKCFDSCKYCSFANTDLCNGHKEW